MDKYYNMIKEIIEKKDVEEIYALREELKNYNMIEFLKRVSALMLFPINQSKSVIFQCIISTALSIPKDEINNSNIMSIGKFKKIVNKFQNLHRREMVDPPEFPFVLPIMYDDNYWATYEKLRKEAQSIEAIEQRIWKVWNNKVGKEYKNIQRQEWTRKKEALIEKIGEELWIDQFSASDIYDSMI